MSTLMSGARMLVECLVREGVDCLFGYPGGVTIPFYDVLYDHPLRHVLVRHEENAAFAAEGYARATGKVGVCCATSGPGATNLTTGLVDAMMDSIPMVAITGQVTSKLIGSDAFQEADTFGITRPCTKHNYLVKRLEDLAQIIHEAFYVAASGRPGPVLVDVTKDVLQAPGPLSAGDGDSPARVPGLHRRPHRPGSPRGATDPGSPAAAGLWRRRHHCGGRGERTARVRRAGRFAGGAHPYGSGRPAFRAPQFHQHAGHARQLRGQHGFDRLRPADRPGRAVRRPRHRAPGGICAARQGHPRGHRPRGNRQEPRARRAHRGRCQARPDQAEQAAGGEPECARRNAPGRPAGLVASHPAVETGASVRGGDVRYRDQAATPDGRDRPALGRPGHRRFRRGAAPDVGGAA